MTIELVTCECCRFEYPAHLIRGEGCCDDCWQEVPALNRLIAGPRDPWSDTFWEAMNERAEERRMERDTEQYYRQLEPYE